MKKAFIPNLQPTTVALNEESRANAENKVLDCLRQHFAETGEILGVRALGRRAHAGTRVPSRVLTRFRRDILREQIQRSRHYSYMQQLFSSSFSPSLTRSLSQNNSSFLPPSAPSNSVPTVGIAHRLLNGGLSPTAPAPPLKKPVCKSLSFDQRKLLTEGEFTLLECFPGTIWMLTVVCPSDSETAYLELAQETGTIPDQLIQQVLLELGKPALKPFFEYRWELQLCGRLHCHLLVHIPGTDPYFVDRIQSALKKTWNKILDDLDGATYCDPFKNENGSDCRLTRSACGLTGCDCKKEWCHTTDWIEKEQQKLRYTYLAKSHKKGRRVRENRVLTILNNTRVSPNSPSGLSPALKALIKQKTERIPIGDYLTRDDCENSLRKLIAQIEPLDNFPWRSYGPQGYPDTGQRCRIDKTQITTVLALCKSAAAAYQSQLDRYQLFVMLTPARFLSVYIYAKVKKSSARPPSPKEPKLKRGRR